MGAAEAAAAAAATPPADDAVALLEPTADAADEMSPLRVDPGQHALRVINFRRSQCDGAVAPLSAEAQGQAAATTGRH